MMIKKMVLFFIIDLFLCFYIVPSGYNQEKSENIMSEEAIDYHIKAKTALKKNDIDTAITYLQKAVSLDAYNAFIHNDLGIAYEKKAMLDRAKAEYKKTINIKPDYAPAYMNLAMLEESLGNIDNAIFYWKARIAFGRTDDPWTQKARMKLEKYAPEEAKKETGMIIEEILGKLQLQQEHKTELAKRHIAYGKNFMKDGDYAKALDEFRIASRLAPDDKDVQRLITEATVSIMHNYFARGVKYYRDRDYESARYNFNQLFQLLPK